MVTGGCKALKGVTRDYKELQGVTGVTGGLDGVTTGYSW